MSRTTTVDTVPAGEVSVAGASRPDPFIKRGTPQFMRVTLALFSAGLATFALLYCVQPILPVLSNEFWRVAGQQQYFAFNFHGDVGGGLACLPARCRTL
ncbi:major facilitator superfamily permease [Klebsiella pneumoniae]|nr:major facilitator superfamily permease [Klebsiella pneumoniae]